MFERMRNLVGELRDVASAIDHRGLTGDQAADLVALFTQAERICAAVRTLAVRRVEETKVWQREGHRNAAQWFATKTGNSMGQAIGVLETARKLEELPATREAFATGRLSEARRERSAPPRRIDVPSAL
jgi:hypothetical protein